MVLLRLTSTARQDSSDFTTTFSSGMRLNYSDDIKYEIALVNMSIYYNYYNISDKLGNSIFKYSIDVGGTITDYSGVIPNGIYTFAQIFDEIDKIITANGNDNTNITLAASAITGKTSITTTNGYAVSFVGTKLHIIFGFDEDQVLTKDTTTESPHHADITNGVNTISLNCSLCAESYENGRNSDTVFTFSPSASPGSLINVSPSTPIYVKTNLQGGDHLKSIRISVEDGLGRKIDLNNEPLSVLLDLKAISPEFSLNSVISRFLSRMADNDEKKRLER